MGKAIVPSTPFEKEIVEVLELVVAHAETIERRFAHLEGHVAELSKRPLRVVAKVKPSKLVLIGLCVGSAYAGYKYAEDKFKSDIRAAKVGPTKQETAADLDDTEAY